MEVLSHLGGARLWFFASSWAKKVLEICPVGVFGICSGCPGLVTGVAGVTWGWTWKIEIKLSLER